jgi:lysophospholipase L1-like esterase
MIRCHRLLVALLGAFLVLAGQGAVAAATPVPTGMGWTVIDRYGGDDNGDGKLDAPEGPSALRPADLDSFGVRVLPSPAICAELDRATWRVDEEAVEPFLEPPGRPGGNCAAVFVVEGEGSHRVKVLARNRSEVARVEVDDTLIVALGDSVASGEGDPDPQLKKEWLNPNCHRSAAAGFQQAANLLGKVDRRRSITFVSLACSGARIDKGLLGPYAGIEPLPAGAEYLPQVDRLAEIAGRRPAGDGARAVDAVLLSVGANDLHFSEVVKRCARLDDCREPAKRALAPRLDALDGDYDELGAALEKAAPDTPVFVSEYFDPTHDQYGNFCQYGPTGRILFTHKEVQWTYEELLRPLNRRIREAAARNEWQHIGGIATEFERHGYCAKDEPWVRTLTEAVALGNPIGTLHPNQEGHQAIARRVAGPLAAALDFQTPAPAPGAKAKDEGLPSLKTFGGWVAAAVTAPYALVAALVLKPDLDSTWRRILAFWLVLPLLLGLLWLAARALLLLRATWPKDPSGARRAPPKLPARRVYLTTRHLLLIALGVAVLFAALVVVAGLVGRAILWLRFWSARLPADQAVSSVSAGELVSTGAVALAIFVGLGLLAAALAWLLDAKGREVRTTRRGLVAIGLFELWATIRIGDFRFGQALQLFLGLTAAALFLHYLVDQVLDWRRSHRPPPPGATEPQGERIWIEVKEKGSAFATSDEHWALRIFKLLPFLFLAVALYFAFHAEGVDRRLLVLLPYVVAAVLFAAPGGFAAPGVKWKNPSVGALLLPRVTLALTGFALVFILLVRDELWLAGVAAVAVLLGLLCLAVAAASDDRFAPYGLAVLISVPLFAGAAAFLHGLDSPELQPVAVVLDGDKAVCGAYVGESEGQLWLAHMRLDERGAVHRPSRGAITPLDSDTVEAKALGPLEPVDLVEPRAIELRDGLLDHRDDGDPLNRTPSCAPSPAMKKSLAGDEQPPPLDWQRELAERYQPELVMDRKDRFWPVPVSTIFSFRDRRAAICRRVAGGGNGCLRLTTPGQFPWVGGEGESLEYPAADNDVGAQHDQMVAALGTADPEASSAEYFLVNREKGGDGPISIQYWFFYPFNYQPVDDGLAEGGFHEGDFESIGVLLSAKTWKPRYVWMNRHNEEGRAFPWDDEALSRPEAHPRVFAARGSHATYENCHGQVRPLDVKGLIDDHPTCDAVQQLHLLPAVTPLIDLSRVGWGCWHGLFGHRNGGVGVYEGSNKFLIADAPTSPLWQQKFGGKDEEVEPCRGLEDPGGRDGRGEEVLEEKTGVPRRLRTHAGALEKTIDDCKDWEKPATSGIYMVVCDQSTLNRFVNSGLEDPGPDGVRIEAIEAENASAGSGTREEEPLAMPAVRRNRSGTYLDDWRISAARPTEANVFASCPNGDKVVLAQFEEVPIPFGDDLTIDDEGPGGSWVLRTDKGKAVAEAPPYTTKAKDGLLVKRSPSPGNYLRCHR